MIGLKRDKHYIGLARLHFRSSNAFYRVLLVRVSGGDDLLVFISKYSYKVQYRVKSVSNVLSNMSGKKISQREIKVTFNPRIAFNNIFHF